QRGYGKRGEEGMILLRPGPFRPLLNPATQEGDFRFTGLGFLLRWHRRLGRLEDRLEQVGFLRLAGHEDGRVHGVPALAELGEGLDGESPLSITGIVASGAVIAQERGDVPVV